MPFLTLSTEYAMSGQTLLDNIFLSEFLPAAPGECVKVYLYGLMLAANPVPSGNAIEDVAKALSIEESDVMDAYTYWQECGLVQITRQNPPEVKYIPLKASQHLRKFKPGKYAGFNNAISGIISGRMISPNEFYEYYSLMESWRIEPDALVMIARYCAELKGGNINYPYILAVARAWAAEGVTTTSRVEEKLRDMEHLLGDLGEVFRALGLKRTPYIEERQAYKRFVDGMGFCKEAIVYAAKKCKKGGFGKLEKLLSEFYSRRALDIKEMDDYLASRDRLYALGRNINRLIGVYYEQLDNVIETYLIPWNGMGFDDDALTAIADYCFKSNIRTLDGMNAVVRKFYKSGLVTADAIVGHLGQMLSADEKIHAVLSAAGLTRTVTSWDRDSYRTWTYSWKLSDELILHAARQSAGKNQPLAFMNKILSDWHERGVTRPEDVPRVDSAAAADTKKSTLSRNYTKREWDAMLDNIEDLEF